MAWTALLPLASFPMAIPQLHAVACGQKDGQALNDHVGGTARLQLVYCILMATGLIISS
jgi:1,4-dihydroxy-2-naphthoate octaprenyltransferase